MPSDNEFAAYVDRKKRYGTPLLHMIQQNVYSSSRSVSVRVRVRVSSIVVVAVVAVVAVVEVVVVVVVEVVGVVVVVVVVVCLLYTSPSPRDQRGSRMPSSA